MTAGNHRELYAARFGQFGLDVFELRCAYLQVIQHRELGVAESDQLLVEAGLRFVDL